MNQSTNYLQRAESVTISQLIKMLEEALRFKGDVLVSAKDYEYNSSYLINSIRYEVGHIILEQV